jgi:hypothetical protein
MNNTTHYMFDKQEAMQLKSDMELELKSYLKTALKKLMLFKKELKADLLFTKDQCTRDLK